MRARVIHASDRPPGAVFAAASWQLWLLAFLPIPVIVVGSLLFQRRLGP